MTTAQKNQIIKLIKSKKPNEIFDLQGITNWSKDLDDEFTVMVNNLQVCGVEVCSLKSTPQQYRVSFFKRNIQHHLTQTEENDVNRFVQEAQKYINVGYSNERLEFINKLNSFFGKLLDERNAFMDENVKIILAILANAGFIMSDLVGASLIYCKLCSEPLFKKLNDTIIQLCDINN
ncbi:MAG: hypothetical protein K2K80_06745 [Clostridia bacterium]|nr:hypothetical protein [Clostridia bacterium]